MYNRRKENRWGSFLKYWPLVRKVIVRNNDDLTAADLEMILYLDSFPMYTNPDIRASNDIGGGDPKKHQRLMQKGWAKKVHKGVHAKGEHDKYTLTVKAKQMVGQIYRQLTGEEDISERSRSNVIFRGKKKVDSKYQSAIRLFNRDKNRTDY